MTKLERWKLEYGCMYPHELGEVCLSEDVARLEAQNAELLEAAKDMAKWWNSEDCEGSEASDGSLFLDIMARFRAAIAKAEETKGEPT